VSYGEFGEEKKALNLVETIAEKPVIRIKICKLEVDGPTLLIIFGGSNFQIRPPVLCVGPLKSSQSQHTFGGLLCTLEFQN